MFVSAFGLKHFLRVGRPFFFFFFKRLWTLFFVNCLQIFVALNRLVFYLFIFLVIVFRSYDTQNTWLHQIKRDFAVNIRSVLLLDHTTIEASHNHLKYIIERGCLSDFNVLS